MPQMKNKNACKIVNRNCILLENNDASWFDYCFRFPGENASKESKTVEVSTTLCFFFRDFSTKTYISYKTTSYLNILLNPILFPWFAYNLNNIKFKLDMLMWNCSGQRRNEKNDNKITEKEKVRLVV